ncbi:hypothetical protein ACEPAG_7610 [Sanghuangporus baumii]
MVTGNSHPSPPLFRDRRGLPPPCCCILNNSGGTCLLCAFAVVGLIERKKRISSLLLSATDISKYNSATQHPFLEAARAGSLDGRLLSLWLSQDRIYAAHAYPRFIGSLVAKIPFASHHAIDSEAEAWNQRILSVLSYSLQNVVREARFFLDTAQKYGLDLGCWKERAATKAYCAEMAHVAGWASLEEGLVFLWAMEKLYLDSWTFVSNGLSKQGDSRDVASHAVREFASNWTNEEFVNFVDDLRSIVDCLNIEVGSELWKRVQSVWDRVIELEIDFWPESLEENQV